MINATVIKDSYNVIKATVIKDSYHINRIATVVAVYPRFIHSELMTHRVFSRNAMSSRAVPVAKMIEQVRTNPATPLHWGANQPGMQARTEVQDVERAKQLWIAAANDAANRAQQMVFMGLHKQVANRILEPFQWMTTIITSTEWQNFFDLRAHEDADPNFQALAVAIRDSLNASTPDFVATGGWHLPFISDDDDAPLDELVKMSAARCARVSYLNHDGSTPDKAKDLDLFHRLASSGHFSPLEHQATPGVADTGNFTFWSQHRKLWEKRK